MNTNDNENSGFTLRAAVIGSVLTLFLLMSTMYVAIKIGAAPWPIIFSVIVSGGLIKLLSGNKPVNLHEMNVAQAGSSIGGLVAAGIAFTVPGILFLNKTQHLSIPWPNPFVLGILTALAGVLGIMLSVPLKYTFVDKENLPYPAGTAGAELLKLGKMGGRQLFGIIAVGAAAGIFALFRDVHFPAGYTLTGLAAVGIFITFLPLPLAIGGGYILGPKAGFSWLAGAVLGWLVGMPLLFKMGFEFTSAKPWIQNLGMGIVLGSGVGFFVTYVVPRLKEIFVPVFKGGEKSLRYFPAVVVLCLVVLLLAGTPVVASMLTIVGIWMMVAVAARMTGETNIDPLEQFGIFVGLLIALVYGLFSWQLNMYASFMIVTFVSVACAVAGDAGHDYKSAAIIGTRFLDIVKVDLITVVVAGLAAPWILEIFREAFADKLFTQEMPAPQALMVSGSIFGFQYPVVFSAGFVFAFLFEIFNKLLPAKQQNRILLMPLGIGLFLGTGLAIPLALGAALRVLVDRSFPKFYHAVLLVAAGVMGGEGIAGFGAGALTIFGLSFDRAANTLLVILAGVLVLSGLASVRKRA